MDNSKDLEVFKKMDQMDEVDDSRKHLYVFGSDLAQIPCFRNSFLYGISTGVAGGLAVFIGTSRPKFSTHCGFGSFMMTTFCYWFYCRYKWSADNFEAMRLKSLMRKQALFEGTEIERKLLERIANSKEDS